MRKALSIKKGLELRLRGAIGTYNAADAKSLEPRRVAVVPDDYPGLRLKSDVREGDGIEAGAPLLHDKLHPEIKIVSPARGRVEAVVRGERRKIERIVVAVDTDNTDAGKTAVTVKSDTPEDIKRTLMNTGLWAMMRQRPFDIVADADVTPRDIFVTGLDTAPLAPSLDQLAEGCSDDLRRGVSVLRKLTTGSVYVSGRHLPDIEGAFMVDVSGPHPSGNAGTIIANLAPVNKGETVWTLDILTLARIGRLYNKCVADYTTLVAVTGPEVITPQLVKTLIGSEIRIMTDGNIRHDGHSHRIISGNVLTGEKVGADGFLRYPWRQITVISEGNDADEFMGWASMSPSKMSMSRSFPGRFMPHRLFSPDARLLGGRRAMIMSGVYDKFMPMDILPEYLIKAIMARDIEKMEALGIYEVAPEDFALAEFADPSKLELQKIVREGLDWLRKEL